jgi:hypothetical protein
MIFFVLISCTRIQNNNEKKVIKQNKIDNYGIAIKDTALGKFWKKYSIIILTHDLNSFKKLANPYIYCCDSLILTKNFIHKSFDKIFDERLKKLFSDSSRIDFSSLDTSKRAIPIHKKVQITIDNTPGGISIFEIDFIQTPQGLKLYGVNSYGEQHCCS